MIPKGSPPWKNGTASRMTCSPAPSRIPTRSPSGNCSINFWRTMSSGGTTARSRPTRYQELHSTCADIANVFGKTRTVADLRPDDFAALKRHLGETRGAVSLRNAMQRCRSAFRFAHVNRLISQPVIYGSAFGKPSLKQVRRNRREHREQNGHRMLTAAEIRQVLTAAGQPLRTMVLLAINGGMGQSDLANLPMSAVDLKAGLIDFPRP